MTVDEFIEKYKPIYNPKEDSYSFETYGVDLEYVKSQPDLHIWTVVDVDGVLWLTNGYHHVNRIHYILTEVPFNVSEFIEINWEEI